MEPTASELAKFAIGTGIASAALYLTYTKQKDDELRRSDVLSWADEVIFTLRKLVTVCSLQDRHFGEEEFSRALHELTFATTALAERGRLFFRNQDVPGWGEIKKPAYRGYRAAILDPIVICYQIACNFKSAAPAERARMGQVAEDCVGDSLSLAQKEVGRLRTASDATRRAGKAPTLRELMNKVEPSHVKEAMSNPRPYIDKPN